MRMWAEKTLGELCSLITDGKHGDCRNEDDSGYYFISCKDVRGGRIHYENARQIVHADFAETHRRTDLRPGDVLLTNSGTIGRLAIAPDHEITQRTTFQKSVAILKPIPERVTFHFLYYSLAADRSRLINSAGGAAQKNLLLGELRRFPIRVPPLTEQAEIASILSAYDDLIENNRRRIQFLEQAARLLYKEWFVHLRFPGHEHVTITDGVPEEWARPSLGEVVNLKRGYDLPTRKRKPGFVPVVSSSGITGFHDTSKANAPGVVTGRYGTLGDVYFIQKDYWPLNTALYVQDFKGNDGHFVFHLLTVVLRGSSSNKAAVPGVNRNDLHRIKVLRPPERLQQLFAETVSPIHQQIVTLEDHSLKLSEARDLLLPRLMNGEVAV